MTEKYAGKMVMTSKAIHLDDCPGYALDMLPWICCPGYAADIKAMRPEMAAFDARI